MFSIDLNSLLKACAAVGPTCLIDKATKTLHKGLDLAACNCESNSSPFLFKTLLVSFLPGALVKYSLTSKSFAVKSKRSPSSFKILSFKSAAADFAPNPSTSNAPRDPT